ncbi:MAG: hypothetical protein AB1545_01760 [Thermodesulfobacteriota bacterium]
MREIFFALHVFSHLFNAGLGDNGITGTKRCNHGKSITTGQDLSCGFPGYFFPYPFLIIKNRSVTSSWQCHAQLGKVPGAPAKYASPAGCGCGFAARVSLSCPVILLSCRQGILAHDTVKIVYVAHVGNLKNVKDLQGDTNISV